VVPLLSSLIIKIPASSESTAFKYLTTIFDLLLVGLTCFVILKSKYKDKNKNLLLAIVAISPGLALVSSGWGQVDSIMTAIIFLALMLAPTSTYLATSLLIVALLTKPQAILAVGVYFLYLFFRFGAKKTSLQAGYLLVIFAILELIFRTRFSLSLTSFFTGAVGQYKNLSLNAFNLWWAIFGRGSWNIQDTGQAMSYKSVGLALFAIGSFPALAYLAKKKDAINLIFVVGYIYLLFFVFPSQIHERYMFPAVALLAMAPLVDKKLLWTYYGLAITFTLNIFAVLQSVYPQFSFLRYDLLSESWTRLAAIANVGICLYLFWWFCQKLFVLKD
jgi:hypothetical protein